MVLKRGSYRTGRYIAFTVGMPYALADLRAAFWAAVGPPLERLLRVVLRERR